MYLVMLVFFVFFYVESSKRGGSDRERGCVRALLEAGREFGYSTFKLSTRVRMLIILF